MHKHLNRGNEDSPHSKSTDKCTSEMDLDSLSRKQGDVADAQTAEGTVGGQWELGDAQRAKSQVSIVFLSQYKTGSMNVLTTSQISLTHLNRLSMHK